jgi:IS605 OrfB family transposase
VVYRTARVGLRVTRGQRRRLAGLLVSAGDVWAAVLELNVWRQARQDRLLVGYQELCRELAASGPGCFGELDTAGARSVLRRYSDAWFVAAKRRRSGDQRARFPRRRRALMPLRWYHGTFTLAGITWAVTRQIGTLAVGDPRGVLNVQAGRRHNQRTRDWRIGHLITVLKDKAQSAGISLTLVDERGTSSTCPGCRSRIPKPAGRVLACPACQFTGHRDLTAAANIAARFGGGITPAIPAGVTHRRAGAHLPGVAPSRRDPRRRAHHRGARGSPGRHRPPRPALTPGWRGSRSPPGEEP